MPDSICPYDVIGCTDEICWYGGDRLSDCEYDKAIGPAGLQLQPLPYDCPDCTVPPIPISLGGGSGLAAGPLQSSEDTNFVYGPNVTSKEESVVAYKDSAGAERFAKIMKVETEKSKAAGKTICIGLEISKAEGAKAAEFKSVDGNSHSVVYGGDTYAVLVKSDSA